MTLARLETVNVGLTIRHPGAAGRTILAGISITLRAGTITVLAGPTGAGKSSLLHLLGGLRRPSEGEVRADGEPISRYTAAHRDRWRRGVGILFQGAELVGDLSAAENILLPLIPRAGSMNHKAQAVDRMLPALGLATVADQPAAELSGGERQRTALARALIADPPLLLLDEPSAHQDDEWARAILDLITAARTRGAMVVLATHDPRILEGTIGDITYFLMDGRLCGDSSTFEVLPS